MMQARSLTVQSTVPPPAPPFIVALKMKNSYKLALVLRKLKTQHTDMQHNDSQYYVANATFFSLLKLPKSIHTTNWSVHSWRS